MESLRLPSSSYKTGHYHASLLIQSKHRHKINIQTSHSLILCYYHITMSDKCGNCDCADKSQCVKKGSSYVVDIVETEKSHITTLHHGCCSNRARWEVQVRQQLHLH
ncbi:hypothetical protein MLD38_000642 [Melastoma candidum]|uniref:Uncharacterized protein n=1 Tax=Melastoma candidum TaxID=119954 RepID=A0ACB9SB58_9MYRT|nr:hypothetical protein MLD38_000642 [Melastoma candidum]